MGIPSEPTAPVRTWPLSYAQELLWFLAGRWPASDATRRLTVTMTDTFDGPLDLTALEAALTDVVARHEVLRSALVLDGDEPRQVVSPPDRVRLVVRDAGKGTDVLAGAHAPEVSAMECPPWRMEALTEGAKRHHLVVVVHHLFFDYWSARLLRTEVREVYDAFRQGLPSPRTAAELQYVDYAVWQRKAADAPSGRAGRDHWVESLADLPSLRLPTDRRRPWAPRGTAHRAVVVLPPDLVATVRALAARHDASPFMVLVGLFMALLAEVSDQEDVAIPTLVAGRTHPATREMLGYFDNILFLRHRRDACADVVDLVRTTRETVLNAFQHHDVPMLRILQEQPRLSWLLADSANVWTLFHLEVDPYRLRSGADGIAAQGDGPLNTRSPSGRASSDEEEVYSFGADLDVTLREEGDAVCVRVLYNIDLFEASTVTELLERYRHALRRAVEDPAARVVDITAGTGQPGPVAGAAATGGRA